MGEFFGSIYCWFEDFFGLELAEYMWGSSSPISPNNSFIGIGFAMFGISLAMVLVYYYAVNPLNIGESEILCFGVSNMILSILAFIIFSFIFKWWSTNCSRAPF